MKVRELLNNDRRLSVRLIAEELGLGQTTVFKLVTEDLMMRNVCAKLVAKVLTDEQKFWPSSTWQHCRSHPTAPT